MQPGESRLFDVFFSYNRESVDSVLEIAEALRDRELRVWLDQWELIPGRSWQEALETIISTAASAAVFVGKEGVGPWQNREMRACLDQFVKRDLPVIPVLLPEVAGQPELPLFLQSLTWVDFRTAPRESALDRLVWGIRGTKVGAVDTAPTPPDLREMLTNLSQELEQRAQKVGRAESETTVPPYNKQFSGRVDELIELRGRLKNDGAGVICGVHGLGGVGKTELAFTYAHAFAGDYPGGRFLVECESKLTLRDALVGTGTLTQLEFIRDGVSEDERKQPDTYFEAIGRCLRARLHARGSVLLVLDNVTDPNLLKPEQTDRLTTLGPTLHLLATTRLPAGTAKHVNWTPLSELPESDALALLEKHCAFADDTEREGAQKIVRRLRGFPLAVELVGAWLAAHPGATYAGLSEGLGLDDLDQFAEDHDVTLRRHNEERRLQAVLDSTLSGLSSAERLAVEYAACLAPDRVVLPWLRDLVVAKFPELGRTDRLGNRWEELCSRLQRLGIFTRAEGEDHRARIVRIHRLVQDVVRGMLSESERSDREGAIERLIHERDTALDETTQWEQARWELEPLEALATLWADNDASNGALLLNQVGQRWSNLAEWARAEPLMRRALDIDEASYGPQHPNVAIRLNNLAMLLKATNRLAEAEPSMRRALDIDEASYKSQHPNVAIHLNNLAMLLKATNRLAEAEPLMRRALAIVEASYGSQHAKVAVHLNNLAALLKATNRLAEAEPLMRRALAIDESSYGPQHPEVATDLNNLAQLLKATNRLAEAEPLMRRALGIDEASFGPRHPNVALHLDNLAQLLQDTNRLAEAEPLMRRALAIDDASFGPQHPNVALHLNNLALLLQNTNRLAEAEPLMRRALAIDEASFGPQHPEVAAGLTNLAQLLETTNRVAEAEPLMRRALAIDEASFGPQHPNVGIHLNNLAQLLETTNRVAEAEPLMRRALAIVEASYGPRHPDVAIRLNNLALLLYATNRVAEAEPLMRRALAINEASFGPRHPNVALNLNNLAQLLKVANRLAEAEPLSRRHLEIFLEFTRSTGHKHPHQDAAFANYAQVLKEMGRDKQQVLAELAALADKYGVSVS